MQAHRSRRLSQRDLSALGFIGEGYEVAQYQLEAAVFPKLSPTVVSRFVRRAVTRGLVVAERLHGVGMNRLRLTLRGRDLLSESGYPAERLFAPRRPVAPKDLTHTLHINDLRTVLLGGPRRPQELWTAWALQRTVGGEVIPDLLVLWRKSNGRGLLLACEIDRGTESLAKVFLPKLRRLAHSLRESAKDENAILVLTEGRRRIEDLLAAAASFERLIVERLPEETGPRALAVLRERVLK